MLAALTLLAAGNLLVHFEAVGIANTAELGNRIGLATLLMLITFVGGRIIPSFTRNWQDHPSGFKIGGYAQNRVAFRADV